MSKSPDNNAKKVQFSNDIKIFKEKESLKKAG
jgi:hypothetical protein